MSSSQPSSMFYAVPLSSRITHDVRPQTPQLKKYISDACHVATFVLFLFVFGSNKIGIGFSEFGIDVWFWENRGTKTVS